MNQSDIALVTTQVDHRIYQNMIRISEKLSAGQYRPDRLFHDSHLRKTDFTNQMRPYSKARIQTGCKNDTIEATPAPYPSIENLCVLPWDCFLCNIFINFQCRTFFLSFLRWPSRNPFELYDSCIPSQYLFSVFLSFNSPNHLTNTSTITPPQSFDFFNVDDFRLFNGRSFLSNYLTLIIE
jgi:hypothetical protein